MNASKVTAGEWWRLFTAMWLHADVAHLAANCTMGLVLLGLVMGRYGTGVGLLGAYLAGAAGTVVGLLLVRQQSSLGASGAVMGCLGLLAAQSFSWRFRWPQHARYFLIGIAAGVMLFVLFGLDPEADVRAHLGGFVAGVGLGAAACALPSLAQSARWNLLAALVFLLLVVVPWWRALLHA